MNTFSNRWEKLSRSKKYREEFVAAQVKRGIPFQIRKLMKQFKLSQDELASRAGIAQGVVSRAANPNYGNLTLNTIIRIAAGFDVAFIGKFVPFTELDKWFNELDGEKGPRIKSFGEENEEIKKAALAARWNILDINKPTGDHSNTCAAFQASVGQEWKQSLSEGQLPSRIPVGAIAAAANMQELRA